MPEILPWSSLYELKLEREVVGFYITGHPLDIYKYEISQFCNATTSHLKAPDNFQGKSLNIGGTISMVSERIDKKGNPFGRFTLEDYQGAYEFMLFGEDYLKHKNKIVDGAMMMITVSVQSNPFFNRTEMKIVKMVLMADLLNTVCKKLHLMIMAEDVNPILTDNIKTILDSGTGNVGLKVTVTNKDGIQSNLQSKRKNYSITGEKLTKLELLEGVNFKLIS